MSMPKADELSKNFHGASSYVMDVKQENSRLEIKVVSYNEVSRTTFFFFEREKIISNNAFFCQRNNVIARIERSFLRVKVQ